MKKILFLLAFCLVAIAGAQTSITGVSPGANSTSLAVNGNIQLTFDASIDGTSLTGNIILRGEHTGVLPFTTTGAGTAVITIDPDSDFQYGEHIYLTVTTGVQSVSASALGQDYFFGFTTETGVSFENPPVLVESEIGTTQSNSVFVNAVDLDSDGDMDMIGSDNLRVLWFENDGSENFTRHTIETGSGSNDRLFGADAVDVDNDGDMDFVGYYHVKDELAWFENDGSESFTKHIFATSLDGPQGVRAIDVDGDGDVDFIAAVEREDRITWYENDGSENFSEHDITTTEANNPYEVQGVDMDDDGDIDIVSASYSDDRIAWYENDGNESFTFHEVTDQANGANHVHAIDIDGDQDMDLISSSAVDDRIIWYENDGGENFSLHEIAITSSANYVHGIDLDGDGDIDIVADIGELVWYENDGSETFIENLIAEVAFVQPPVADINQDGKMDIILNSSRSIYWYENKTNTSPQLDNAIADQAASAYLPFSFTFNENTFSDSDGSFLLSYSATKSDDSALPSWLSFDGESRQFSGNPQPADAGTLSIKVTATDPVGASATDEFDIVVTVPTLMEISSISPQANDVSVSNSSNIQIVFDETIDASTLNSDNLVIRGSKTGVIDGAFSGGGTTTITFNPTADFRSGEQVFVTLTTDLESEAGSILQGNKSFNFIAATSTSPSSPALIVEEASLSTSSDAQRIYAADLDGDGDEDLLVPARSSNKVEFFKNDGSGNFTVSSITTSPYSSPRTIYIDDVDLDGDLDMITNSSNNLVWYDNDGSESFTANLIESSIQATSIVSGDLDGDGDTDILIANRSGNSVFWYANDGNQNFSKKTITTSLTTTIYARMADMDGDLDLDVIAGSGLAQDEIYWYENDGGQNFTAQEISLAANDVDEILPIDLDEDGDMDLLAAERTDDEFVWYENDGSQNFTARIIDDNVDGPISLAAGDLDGDGDLDLVCGTDIDNKVIWYDNDGDENFTAYQVFDMEGHDIELADLDGDGVLDVINVSDAENTVVWAKNKANTSPTLENLIADQEAIAGIAFSFTVPGNTFDDVDGNELLNFTATRADSSPLPAWLTFDEETQQFSGTPELSDVEVISILVEASDPTGASVSDEFDLDVSLPPLIEVTTTSPVNHSNYVSSTSDIVITFDEAVSGATLTTSNIIVRGEQSGHVGGAFSGGGTTSVTFNPSTNFAAGEKVHVTVTTNVEGTIDEVVGTPYYFSFIIESSTGPGLFVAQDAIESNAQLATSVAVMDLDQDGNLDVLSTSRLDDKLNWYANNGSESFTTTTVSSSVNGARDVFSADLDADGDYDLIVSEEDDGKLLWFENNGSQSFTEQTLATSVSGVKAIYVIDMEGDGDLDVVSSSTSKMHWHENDGSESFTTHDLGSTGSQHNSCYAIDIDGDNDIDILAGSSTKLSWFENDGTESFTQNDLPFTINSVEDLTAIDVDDDGDIDIVSVERSNDEVVWYENDGSESFTEHVLVNDFQEVYSILAADLDGDGDIDFAGSSSEDDKVVWFENDGSESFTTNEILGTVNGPRSLVAGDLDNDGDLDLVSANYNGNDVTWYLNRSNAAPVVDNLIDDQTANEDEAFTFTLPSNIFSDPDDDDITLSASLQDDSELPEWLSFEPSSGEFSGTPLSADIGTITIKVTADDGLGESVSDEFELEVVNTNDDPVLDNEIPNQTAVSLTAFSFTFDATTFSDEDGDELSYSAKLDDESTLPSWLTFTSSTRTFEGTPTNDDVGTITIVVTADDANGGMVTDQFDLEVIFTNQAPVLDNPIIDQTASEDSPFELVIASNTFSDPDGDDLEYDATLTDDSALPSWLTFDDATRTFGGTPEQSDVGLISIKVIASDPAGETASDNFDLEVEATNDSPVLSQGLTDQTAPVGEAFTYVVSSSSFTDPDGDDLSYSALLEDGSSLPEWLVFESSTITFSGTPEESDAGMISVELFASDPDNESASDIFEIEVLLVNNAPTVLNPIDDQEASIGRFFFMTFAENTFADQDEDPLTYSATLSNGSPLPSWLSFDESERSFSGTPNEDDEGVIIIALTAEDPDGAVATDEFEISVEENRQSQTISFEELQDRSFGDDQFDLSATTTSGLTISYSSSNQDVATIDGNTVTIVGVGSASITASQAGNVDFFAAEDVNQLLTVNKASQEITFGELEDKVFGDAPFTLTGASNAGLEIVYSSSDESVATITGNEVTILNSGTVTITASQDGNDNYEAAAAVEQILTINKADQIITFNELPEKAVGGEDFTLNATSSSGLEVSYSSSNTDVATINGNTVTIVGEGTSTITASQAGNDNYNPAEEVGQELVVTSDKSSQTITFEELPSKTYGDDAFNLTATSTSGLTISYSSSDESVATISGSEVTIIGAGTTMITASQDGNDEYAAAEDVQQMLTVNKADQVITFSELPEKSDSDEDFELTATSSSGLDVSYTSSNPSVATISGSTVSIVGEGSTVITASQAGDNNYNAAEQVEQTLVVSAKTAQTITFEELPSKTYGDDVFNLTASSTSGLTISYTSSDESVATISGSEVTIIGAGTVMITASQVGNDEFLAAESVQQMLTVNKADQTITFEELANMQIGEVVSISGSSSSGLVVTFSVTGPATLTDNQLEATGEGTVTITASQSGDANYNAATEVERSFEVTLEAALAIEDELVTVYPNPVVNRLNINSSEPVDLQIYDMKGSIVIKKDQVVNSVDLSSLLKGIYVLEIRSEMGVQRMRIKKAN